MGFALVLLSIAMVMATSTHIHALPICLNQEAPRHLRASLVFCSSYVRGDFSCCDATMDKQLDSTFHSFNVSDSPCATFLKQILCAQCDPYAGDLFQAKTTQEPSVPALCNSTFAVSSTSASMNSTSKPYCENVWDACNSVPIENSPFTTGTTGTSKPDQNATVLIDIWKSKSEFCTSLGGALGSGDFCFYGEQFTEFNTSIPPVNLEGICFERIGDGAYLNMIPLPDGSNRVFVSSQSGKIWLATIPTEGSGKTMMVNESSPFLDISDRVISSGEYGLLGVAFHPNYKSNGRFFVSYNCDKSLWPDCAGRCACNEEAGCMLSSLGPDAEAIPCQISSIVAEYSVNMSSTSSSPLRAVVADPNEVRRIFTMGLPYTTHHAGQILFGLTDNYLYLMMGDGGSTGDPFNFAQNKMSLLGKILRFDVDAIPSAAKIVSAQLWGNYSIPFDNPFVQENNSQPEIWAYGLRNPWRCSFDYMNPSYFYCADVGQEKFEEVDLITKGGNYGWRVFEGTVPYMPPSSPGGNTSAASIDPIFPILEYSHVSVNPTQNSASITGGYVSRSTQDACLYGRYVYGDLYGGAMWTAVETPAGSGNYMTARVNFTCSTTSPMECKQSVDNPEPNFLYLFSYGEDNAHNLYALSAMGVYRVVNPKGCGFSCNAKLPAGALIPPVPLSPSASIPAPASIATPSPQKSFTSEVIPSLNLRVVPLALLTLMLIAC